MRTLKIGDKIEIHVAEPSIGDIPGGSISSQLERETCPHCHNSECCFDCDESGGDETDVVGRLKYNGALDGIESLLLACAAQGIAVDTPAFANAVTTALDACSNNLRLF